MAHIILTRQTPTPPIKYRPATTSRRYAIGIRLPTHTAQQRNIVAGIKARLAWQDHTRKVISHLHDIKYSQGLREWQHLASALAETQCIRTEEKHREQDERAFTFKRQETVCEQFWAGE